MINRNKHSNPDSELYRAMLTLRTPEECHNFLCDLCTQSELNAIEQRYDVAKMLSLGKSTTRSSPRPTPAPQPSAVSTARSRTARAHTTWFCSA